MTPFLPGRERAAVPRRPALAVQLLARVGGLLLCALALPSHAGSLTLEEAVRQASEQSPGLQAQDAAILATQEDAVRADALPDPMLEFGIDSLPITGPDAFDPSVEDMTMKRVGVRQEFPAAAKREARRLVADRRIDAARAEAVAEQLRVQRAAADAWIDAWTASRQLQALEPLREQTELVATLAEARLRGGGGSSDEVLAAKVALVELEGRRAILRGDETEAQSRLRRWVPAADAVEGQPDFSTLPIDPARLADRLESMAPLLLATARVELAAAAVTAARAEKRSDWSVMAAYGQRDSGRSDMLMVEFGVSLPLFGRNRQDRDVAARQAEYQQAAALQEDERRALVAELDAAVARWEALKVKVVLHSDRLLPLALDRSAAALASYRAGGALDPWLDARAEELRLREEHAEDLGQLGRAWAALAFLLPETAP